MRSPASASFSGVKTGGIAALLNRRQHHLGRATTFKTLRDVKWAIATAPGETVRVRNYDESDYDVYKPYRILFDGEVFRREAAELLDFLQGGATNSAREADDRNFASYGISMLESL